MTSVSRDGHGPDPQDDPAIRRAQEERLARVWEQPKGWRYWTAVNNSEVGLWYIVTSFAFMLFAGVLGLLIRAQLARPDGDLLSAELYNQVFTLHGTAMMFLFGVPIFEAVAILLLPALLGARDLPFPRLSAFGFWCFLLGGLFVCGSIFFDAAPNSGWFMYPPLSIDQGGIGAEIWLLGLSFIEVASIAAAVELIVGVLKCRPPGMHLNLTPLYGWYVLIVGGMIVFAFPPLIAGDFLFELEKAFDWPFFDASRGGDPLLWQHLFWIFGHPEVYIIFLPSIALLAMIVPTFAQRPIAGYSWVVLSAIGTGFISFGLWAHHMYTTGMPSISLGFFSAASEAVVIPTGIQIFVFIATLMMGRVIRSVPMLFALGALMIFVAGGLTGVMIAVAPFDFQGHDSYFIVAHLHYTLFGGMVFPLMAGFYYYFPLAFGKLLSRRLGIIAFWLLFVGFNVTFLPMHLTGLLGMPRRVFTYPQNLGWEIPNLVSSLGAIVIAAGFATVILDVIRTLRNPATAPRNPWNAGTVEWMLEMPPKPWGARTIPHIESRYPIWDAPDFLARYDAGRFYLPDAEEGKRETIVTSVLDADPVQCLRVPGPGLMPIVAAVALAAMFFLATFHLWTLTVLAGFVALGAILWWLWTGTALPPEKPVKEIGLGERVPIYMAGPQSVGWWAMFITMTADLVAYLSLVFSYFFFWTIHTDFPPADAAGPGWAGPLAAGLLFVLAWGLTLAARKLNDRAHIGATRVCLGAGILAGAAGIAALIAGPALTGLDATHHAYPAIVWALVVWIVAHAGIGLVSQGFCLAGHIRGRLTSDHDADIWNTTLYWHFLLFTALVTTLVIGGFPLVA